MAARALLVTLVAVIGAVPAGSAVLKIEGTAGYLSEWELAGAAAEDATRRGEIVGSVTWTHVGLCSVSGPEQRSGELRARILGAGAAARIEAVLSFDGARCAYSGPFSGRSIGHMDCSHAKGVPLTIAITRVARE